ncbi:MAG TPA: cobyric acid synthase CobQ, partial [Methanocorpusculum sp.]|nr:cobyric acid synthase CobQ [Methanocorpusculum sp.]
KFAKSGKPVIGICGGYQMMGRIIIDRAVEGDVFGKYSGLGLLNIETEFLEYKKITGQRLRKSNDIEPIISKMGNVRGYEIHAGITKVFGREVFDGEGCCDESGLIFGTYLHGLFSENAPVDALLSYLFEKKGLNYVKMQDSADPYEELADHLTKNLDCDALIKIASGK